MRLSHPERPSALLEVVCIAWLPDAFPVQTQFVLITSGRAACRQVDDVTATQVVRLKRSIDQRINANREMRRMTDAPQFQNGTKAIASRMKVRIS